jgi:hypothetical protein
MIFNWVIIFVYLKMKFYQFLIKYGNMYEDVWEIGV